jgi:hypothetical protein
MALYLKAMLTKHYRDQISLNTFIRLYVERRRLRYSPMSGSDALLVK